MPGQSGAYRKSSRTESHHNLSESTSTQDPQHDIPLNSTAMTGMSQDNTPTTSTPSRNKGKGRQQDTPRRVSSRPSEASPHMLSPPSFAIINPTPEASPVEPRTPQEKGKGKRKAEEVESGGTPPDVKKEKEKGQRATFAPHDPRRMQFFYVYLSYSLRLFCSSPGVGELWVILRAVILYPQARKAIGQYFQFFHSRSRNGHCRRRIPTCVSRG